MGFDEAIWKMIALSIAIYLLDFVQDNLFTFRASCQEVKWWRRQNWMHYLIGFPRDAVTAKSL